MLIDKEISYFEIASVNFDLWILTVALIAYNHDQSVCGIIHVVFKKVGGFRLLDEGDMLMYPFPEGCTRKYVQEIPENYWMKQEMGFGNIVHNSSKEYLIATENECLCVISSEEPTVIKELKS